MSLSQLLLRRKVIDMSPSTLARKLGTLDLTFLGMGATLGAGAYVLVGIIAKTKTGPSIVLSFLISGIASILSALCYAEFGARVPKAGSAYVYSYVTVGEVLAWTTGWQLLLEYIIGGSAVARAWSGYVDSLANGAVSSFLNARIGNWSVPGLATYPDFLAFGMTLLLSVVCSIGVRESTMLNNGLTAVNICVILFVIVAGAFYANPANMTPFLPFGVSGVFTGAATAFYSYVGFDVIATSAEEVKNPKRAIPLSILLSLALCMVFYMAVSITIVLMVPYASIDEAAPLSQAFALHNAVWAKYIIAVGAVCGLSTSLMTSIFPMPRIVYAIAADGLLPAWTGAVHPWTNTPVLATMGCGLLTGLLALVFDLSQLADMMSCGTLLSYSLVAASVLVLRYRTHDEALLTLATAAGAPAALAAAATATAEARAEAEAAGGKAALFARSSADETPSGEAAAALSPLLAAADGADAAADASPAAAAVNMAPAPRLPGHPDSRSGVAGLALAGFYVVPAWSAGAPGVRMWGAEGWTAYAAAAAQLGVYCAGVTIASVAVAVMQTQTVSPAVASALYGMLAVGALVAASAFTCLLLLPQGQAELSFTTPFVPVLPLVSVAINIYLLVSLSPFTWVRFGVWCAIGTAIYVFYGIRHSKARISPDEVAAFVAAARRLKHGSD